MDNTSKNRLRPSLSFFDATAIGLGAIIGGGIFIVTGIVAGLAGPALVLSIIIAALISLFTALSFVELTTWQPTEGGVYVFAHSLISPFAGFLSGWMWVISNIFSGAAVALGFAHYLAGLLPSLNYRLVAIILCLLFTLLNCLGIKHSASFNNILVIAKIVVLLIFILVGSFHFKAANFAHFIKSESGVFRGAFFIFFAFAGFGRVATLAEEVRNARKVVPQSIISALFISTVIYILVGTAALGLAGSEVLGKSNSPLADAIGTLGKPIFKYIVSLGGMLAMASVLLTSILGISRMTFAMARERDLPFFLTRLHPKYKTPYLSILIVGIMLVIISSFLDLARIVEVSTFATLFNYSLANVSALKLKAAHRLYPRAIPAIGLTLCLALSIFVQRAALRIGFYSLLAVLLYFLIIKAKRRKNHTSF